MGIGFVTGDFHATECKIVSGPEYLYGGNELVTLEKGFVVCPQRT